MFLKKIIFFLWAVKSLVLVPWDIYTDVNLAITHFNNGHMAPEEVTSLGAMTVKTKGCFITWGP